MMLLRSFLQRSIFPQARNCTTTSHRGIRGRNLYREEKVVVNEDGSVIVCWHPEPKFPYELTQPVPREIQTEQT